MNKLKKSNLKEVLSLNAFPRGKNLTTCTQTLKTSVLSLQEYSGFIFDQRRLPDLTNDAGEVIDATRINER